MIIDFIKFNSKLYQEMTKDIFIQYKISRYLIYYEKYL
jgi:hypothetical protein